MIVVGDELTSLKLYQLRLTLHHCPEVGRALRARRSVRRAEDCPPYPMVQFQGENGITRRELSQEKSETPYIVSYS